MFLINSVFCFVLFFQGVVGFFHGVFFLFVCLFILEKQIWNGKQIVTSHFFVKESFIFWWCKCQTCQSLLWEGVLENCNKFALLSWGIFTSDFFFFEGSLEIRIATQQKLILLLRLMLFCSFMQVHINSCCSKPLPWVLPAQCCWVHSSSRCSWQCPQLINNK